MPRLLALLTLATPAAAAVTELHPHGWHNSNHHHFHKGHHDFRVVETKPVSAKEVPLSVPHVLLAHHEPAATVAPVAHAAAAAPVAKAVTPKPLAKQVAPVVAIAAASERKHVQAPAARKVAPVAAPAAPVFAAPVVAQDFAAPEAKAAVAAPEVKQLDNPVVSQLNQELAEQKQRRTNIRQLQQALEADVALLRESSQMVKVAASESARSEAESQVRHTEQLVHETSAMLRGSRQEAQKAAVEAMSRAKEIRTAAAALEAEASEQLHMLEPKNMPPVADKEASVVDAAAPVPDAVPTVSAVAMPDAPVADASANAMPDAPVLNQNVPKDQQDDVDDLDDDP